ncbi:MAG TPA: TIGR03435 family protein [Acidobacteriaceae bacterium]|jgi:uncharacterized protein (TIGR03435 family)|nr:TIGR03435 family protein [Acidobacteriaceae bacterium]
MKRRLLSILSLVVFFSSALFAQSASPKPDIVGTWQGTLHAGQDLRLVLKVSRDDKGALKAVNYSIDQGGQPLNVSSISLEGSAVKFTVDLINGTYEGKLSADGNSIEGTWSQGTPLPLNFVRVTAETAWAIPAPPPPPKLMAADADPSFEVATIKPNNSGKPAMQALVVRGRNFETVNSSLGDLVEFAYEVQASQIVNAPSWLNGDRYDLSAIPDQEGEPSPAQLRTMMRKLLANRFKLTFHKETREMSAYVLTIGKSGEKLTPTQINGPLPGLGFAPDSGGLRLMVRNGTMDDFTGFLQSVVLDRPVLDKTGLTGRYDFQFAFTPDDSEFNGHPPQPPAGATSVSSAPNLFDALQQQLGLKLDGQKAPVPVIAIDHVEHPTPN